MAQHSVNYPNNVMETQRHQVPRAKLHDRRAHEGHIDVANDYSLSVTRDLNQHVQEYDSLYEYIDLLAAMNGAIDEDHPHQPMSYMPDDEGVWMVPPKELHVTILGANAVKQIVARHIAFKGRIDHPQKLKRGLRSASSKINNAMNRKNKKIVDTVAYDMTHGSPADDLLNETIQLSRGEFRVRELRTFGHGNKFGLRFTERSEVFLREERAKSLDIVLSSLAIRSLDPDIEHTILSGIPHMTVMYMGDKTDRTVIEPTAEDGIILPETVVTGFDPKASTKIRHE